MHMIRMTILFGNEKNEKLGKNDNNDKSDESYKIVRIIVQVMTTSQVYTYQALQNASAIHFSS